MMLLLEEQPSAMEAIKKLDKDLKAAARLMGRDEARFLVDAYYAIQQNRIRANHQMKQCAEQGEPSAILAWQAETQRAVENNIKVALGVFAKEYAVGRWMMSITGIGPVIAAGLLSQLDIRRSPYPGNFWAFCGLNPDVKWTPAATLAKMFPGLPEKLSLSHINEITKALKRSSRTITNKLGMNPPYSKKKVMALLAMRPWSESAKTLVVFKLGESFVKVQSNDKDVYGHLFAERKKQLWERNLAGKLSTTAVARMNQVSSSTNAYKWYSGAVSTVWASSILASEDSWPQAMPKESAVEDGVPMLPPSHIHAQARRYAAKLFLSHLHSVMFEDYYEKPAPEPWITEKAPDALGHHVIPVPHWPNDLGGKSLRDLLG